MLRDGMCNFRPQTNTEFINFDLLKLRWCPWRGGHLVLVSVRFCCRRFTLWPSFSVESIFFCELC